jgi:hypothetical protein
LKEEMKIPYDKLQLKEFIVTKLALQKILKGIIHTEEEHKHYCENIRKNKLHLTGIKANED